MKATELRIGNLVYFENGGGIVYKVENLFNYEGDKYRPIPLTEEWLVKFGFDKTSGDHNDCYMIKIKWYLSSNEFCYLLLSSSNYYWIGYNDDKHDNIDIGLGKIDFVHQLQNLYFALTGEELTIKE